MLSARPEITLGCPTQMQLDWLLKRWGVTVKALIRPTLMRTAMGIRAADGRFDCLPDGPSWLAFEEPEDWVLWQPRTGELATYHGRAFALGEDVVYNPGTYSFDCRLNIFSSPLEWLCAKRDGCVVIDWTPCWSRLHDVPCVAVDEQLLSKFKQAMRPPGGPKVFVRTNQKAAA